MASGTPYIGSKISLISKAEIRYEGILYDVDSKEATVTLSKVRSYGTENRQATKQIPPRNEVYEYIIFRGSDIKDLTVSEMGNREDDHPLDPAIVSAQSTAPPSTSRSDHNMGNVNTSRSTGVGSAILPTPHPVPPGGGYTQFPPGLGGYNPFGMPYFGRPPMMMGQPLHPHPMQQHPSLPNQQPHPHTTPPAHISTITNTNNHPSTDRANLHTSVAKSMSEATPPVTTTVTTTTNNVSTPINQGFVPPAISQQTHSKTASKPRPRTTDDHHQSETTTPPSSSVKPNSPLTNHSSSSPEEDRKQSKREGRRQDGGQRQYINYTPSRGSRGNNWRGPRDDGGYTRTPRGEGGYTRTPRGEGGYSRTPRGEGGYSRTPRGEGRYSRTPRGGNRGGFPSSSDAVSQQQLKYTKDFDFESANALFSKDQFEKEMRLKLKLTDDQKDGGSDGGEPPVSVETEELEEGEIMREELVNDIDEEQDHYDKTKSFFDTISCESTQTQTNRRSNRSQDIALNTETFGVTNRGRSRNNQGRGYNPRYRGGRGYHNQYNGYNHYRGNGGYRGGRGGYYGNGRGQNFDQGGYNDYQGRESSRTS